MLKTFNQPNAPQAARHNDRKGQAAAGGVHACRLSRGVYWPALKTFNKPNAPQAAQHSDRKGLAAAVGIHA